MTTQLTGGRITGRIALTVKATPALNLGDYVHLTGDYQVALSDGTKPILGHVSVKNVKRSTDATSDTYPVGNPGGDVTVEALGHNVSQHAAGGTIVAGQTVGINSVGALVPAGSNISNVGLALTGGGVGVMIDILGRA